MIVWHYTKGIKVRNIYDNGCLLPATFGIVPPELPVVWFSANQHFENSALSGEFDARGNHRNLTIEEMMKRHGGLYRFGRPAKGLLHGEELRKAAKISLSDWRGLAKVGEQMGASASDWYGAVVDDMPIDGMHVHRMNEKLVWEAINIDDLDLLPE